MTTNLDIIAAALKQVQTTGTHPDSNFVIFNIDTSKNYYVQLAVESNPQNGLHAEAVSNEFLDPEARLDQEQIRRLHLLGWKDPESSPNYERDWIAATDADRWAIAREILQTCVDVYGMSPHHQLDVITEIS